MATEKLPAAERFLPRKVRGVLALLRRGPWEAIEITREPLAGGFIYHIKANRHSGTLASTWLQTSLFYSGRTARRGRLGRIHLWHTIGADYTRDGWWWLRTYAERG